MSTVGDTRVTDVRRQIEKDGKEPAVVSTGAFLVTMAVLLPVWATIMLPLTLVYQLFKGLYDKLSPPEEFRPRSPFDSGYQVAEGDVIPRSQRTYDVVVLGATGFAGKLAVRYLAKAYGVNKEVKWAIAGRSQAKLNEVKSWLAEDLGLKEVLEVDCIIVDTSVPATLPNLVRNTRAVVTTAGPFWDYGSSVVEFCSKFGTHYADITGESSWVKTMMDRWQATAKVTGAKIVSLAGHDCIPWDLSVTILAKKLKDETGEDLATVTCYDEVKAGISGGTLATMMLALGAGAPAGPKSDPFRLKMDGTEHLNPFKADIKLFPSKLTKPWDSQSTFGSPFLMAVVNAEVVSWSQALRGGAPLTYSEVLVNPDLKTAIVSYFNLVLLITGLLNPVTKYLLSKFVLPKPGEGPSFEDMENNSFLSVSAHGMGTQGSKAEAIMYFPRDAGYMDTARMLVESGLSMALEEEALPVKGGGFFSPGYGLGETLLNRLVDTGTYFQASVHKARKLSSSK
jgi:short subunit dehydrogenase-like uncharacterized protein